MSFGQDIRGCAMWDDDHYVCVWWMQWFDKAWV